MNVRRFLEAQPRRACCFQKIKDVDFGVVRVATVENQRAGINTPSPKCEPRPRARGPLTAVAKLRRARPLRLPLTPFVTCKIETAGRGRPRRKHSSLMSPI